MNGVNKVAKPFAKYLAFIHPLSWHAKTVPGGAPSFRLSTIRFRLNIKSGGTYCPVAHLAPQKLFHQLGACLFLLISSVASEQSEVPFRPC